jgi:3-oxoacyl-[acyl-carrier protein] reductase
MNRPRPVCAVTGGTFGIGRHIAELLGADGWAVGLCSRHADEAAAVAAEIEQVTGAPVLGLAADVSSAETTQGFADLVRSELGAVSAVFANAAVLGPVGPLHTLDMAAWATAVAIDLVGVANTIAAFAPGLTERRSGSIITFAGGGVGGPDIVSQVSAYTSSKAAVVTLTETVGKELEPFGVRVNAVAPGAFATRFMDPLIDAGPGVVGGDLFAEVERQRSQPVDFGSLDALVRYLVDLDAPFVTGRLFSAKWESPEALRHDPPPPSSSRYRLRRIDEDLYREVVRTGAP